MASLTELKQNYSSIESRFNLPSFHNMNQEFDIEKLAERETDFLLREVRRAMLEKNEAYLRFLELLLNPAGSPMFVLALKIGDKKSLHELYLELGKYELQGLALDNSYNEEKEAEFINMFFKRWEDIKSRFRGILDGFEIPQASSKKEKGYLG